MTMHVTWEIDLDAGSPREAAEQALEIIQHPDSAATVFNVVDDQGEQHTIDLMEEGAADG